MTVEPESRNTLPSFGLQYREGSHRGPMAPARCQKCGRPMRVYETQGFGWHPRFKSDGTPNMVRHARCSAPFLARLIGFHDHAIQDEFGDWPWV